MRCALDVLQKVFGFESFRGQQEEVIQHVLAGQDALLLMPTGGGKSLCYQIPAILRPGLGIVVSPLIALMQDQVAALRAKGVRAAYLNSMLTNVEAWEIKGQMMRRELDLLYVSPERALMPGFLKALDQLELALFAIDEAHCVSQWGHEFRPEYLELHQLRDRYPTVPRLALTATADLTTREEIVKRLQLRGNRIFVSSFDRPNLTYLVQPKAKWQAQILNFLGHQPPKTSGIIYRLTRKSVDETAAMLRAHGHCAIPYHAGLEDEVRREHQAWFVSEPGALVVATIAFGMGIDKPDVRFVAHLDMPRSLEDYHQQTGRAGRDGLPATAWMTYGPGDAALLGKLIAASEADEAFKKEEQKRLRDMIRFCETRECRRRVLLRHFGEELAEDCGNCDNCRTATEQWDATLQVEKALLCIVETGQRFGAAYLTDILTGKLSKRVLQNAHGRLRTFGLGNDLHADDWRSIFAQMVGEGLVTVDTGGYSTLKISREGSEVLNGERTVLLRREPRPVPRAARTRAAAGRRTAPASQSRPTTSLSSRQALPGADSVLYGKLRDLRSELAQQAGVPAYVIFSDATLQEMAARRPESLRDLLQIKGIGETKLERYGYAFLKVLQGG